MRTCLAILLLLPLCCAADPPSLDRRQEGEARVVSRSADGRYAFSAQARQIGTVRRTDHRYAVKAVNVDCDPLPDPLFANGFETP